MEIMKNMNKKQRFKMLKIIFLKITVFQMNQKKIAKQMNLVMKMMKILNMSMMKMKRRKKNFKKANYKVVTVILMNLQRIKSNNQHLKI